MNKLNDTTPLLIVVMGVSGSGKSTLAKHLSETLTFTFVEADDFHTTQARAMMSNGVSLTSDIRQEWVDRLCSYLANLAKAGKPVVLAYSGLKKLHRQQFRQLGSNQHFFMLTADHGVIKERMEKRKGHFINADFLNNQLADMEYPTPHETDVEMINVNDEFSTISKHVSALIMARNKTPEMNK